MPLFEIEAFIPGNEPEGRPILENFYAPGGTPEQAMAAVRATEGVVRVRVVRELTEEEIRRFRYLPNERF